mgnify:CR=1 FL=1
MKPAQRWHFTRVGRVILFLGSIQFAVPVMASVAVAMAWGTYLESKHNAQVSRATVYGSWWFVVLMGLICVSLVLAVVTRFPWKRKHVGFMTVHAGLVLLIFGGFWSLFGRVEGHIGLDEGTASNMMETDKEVLSVSEFKAANSTALGEVSAPHVPAEITLAGMNIQVHEFWENCKEESFVANDGSQSYRAVELALDAGVESGEWVGEETGAGGPSVIDGVRVRVLPDGASWTPPASPSGTDYFFTFDGRQYPLAGLGEEAFPGWKVASLRRFTKATVTNGVLADTGTQDNPAVEVVLCNDAGTTERHRCFRSFPDMVMMTLLHGSIASGATLGATPPSKQQEVLVVFGEVARPRLGFVDFRGDGRELEPVSSDGEGLGGVSTTAGKDRRPQFAAGKHRFVILNEFAHARSATRTVRAPIGPDRRPALVLSVKGASEPCVIPWKGYTHVADPSGRNLLLSYGPMFVELPFTIRLKDFRKMDYPGTEMAMAYESEVAILTPGEPETSCLIHMNAPYSAYPWKVYQSGFSGESTSIFSVMRDPGLKMTYVGSGVLCAGIFLTFFSRSFSWGHPGIPAPHLQGTPAPKFGKESIHASVYNPPSGAVPGSHADAPGSAL